MPRRLRESPTRIGVTPHEAHSLMSSGVSDSVRDRFLNRMRTTGENHQVGMILFMLEGFLVLVKALLRGCVLGDRANHQIGSVW